MHLQVARPLSVGRVPIPQSALADPQYAIAPFQAPLDQFEGRLDRQMVDDLIALLALFTLQRGGPMAWPAGAAATPGAAHSMTAPPCGFHIRRRPTSGWTAPQRDAAMAAKSAPPAARHVAAAGRPAGGATAFGQRVADAASRIARARGTTGWCYKGVADALEQAGVTVTGGSAYMAADQLARNPRFLEARVDASQLGKLPAGAVVVWGKTGPSPHGHISVALGDGREASDHIAGQMTSLRGYRNARVFLPR